MEQQLGFRSSSWLCFALGLLFPFLALVAVAGQVRFWTPTPSPTPPNMLLLPRLML